MGKYRNRGIGHSSADALVSGRIGVGGVRTFHVNFGAKKVGSRAIGAIDYVAAEGDYENRDDLEAVVGNVDGFRYLTDIVDRAAKWRKGRTAERVLITMVTELPANFSNAQRQETANRLVQYWKQKGHKAIAAIHGNGIVQPHIHLGITARPFVFNDQKCLVVDRHAEPPLRGKAAVRSERKTVASIINEVAGTELFHPGRLIDTGVTRTAKRRLTVAEYKAGIDAIKDTSIVHQQHVEYERKRREAAQRSYLRTEARIKRRMEQAKNNFLVEKAYAERKRMKYLVMKYAAENKRLKHEQKVTLTSEAPAPILSLRDADSEPATNKQLAYLLDLAEKAKRVNATANWLKQLANEDRSPTKGEVGIYIRQLKKLARDRSYGR